MTVATETTYTYSDYLYSDHHKDAYGTRPRGGAMERWNALTPSEKQDEWDSMSRMIAMEIEESRIVHDENLAKFKALIAKTIELGAGDETTALRWITQNETFYNSQSVDMFVYGYGLSYEESWKLEQKLYDIVTYAEWDD